MSSKDKRLPACDLFADALLQPSSLKLISTRAVDTKIALRPIGSLSSMLPLTLTLDTGPDFNVESIAFPVCRTPSPKATAVATPTTMSFGHPGISALEFAGTAKDDSTPATLAIRGKSISDDTTHEEIRQKLMVDLDPPQPILLEIGSQQGRRGLFLNHTPREWEMRGSKGGHGHKTSYASSDASHTATWTQHWRRTTPRDWSAEECIAILAANGPGPEIEEEDEGVEDAEVQQDVVKEETTNEEEVPKLRDSIVTDATYSRPQTATQAFIASSMAAKIATPPALRRSSARSSLDVGSLRSGQYPQNTGKRRRRQTPFKLTAPSNLIEGKHAPLEPLVAYHRRTASAQSNIPETPPKPDPETIARYLGTKPVVKPSSENSPGLDEGNYVEASTYRAIHHYFESQPPSPPLLSQSPETAPTERFSSPAPHESPLAVSPISGKETDGLGIHPAPHSKSRVEVVGGITAPLVPCRSPKRPTYPKAPLHPHNTNTKSDDGHDRQADKGHPGADPHIPIHEHVLIRKPITKPQEDERDSSFSLDVSKQRPAKRYYAGTTPGSRAAVIAAAAPAPAGTGKLGRMAPPVPGHEALLATAELNDLCFYLKNTGPSPDPSLHAVKTPNKIRKRSGIGMFRARGASEDGKKRKGSASEARVMARNISKEYKERVMFTPSCAREMTTSKGARYRGIVIPWNSRENVQEPAVTITIANTPTRPSTTDRKEAIAEPHTEEDKAEGLELAQSISWTESMLNPLASSALEQVIGDYTPKEGEDATERPETPPQRSPKSVPVSARSVATEDHPLLTREDRVRARKLRDMQRTKHLTATPSSPESSNLRVDRSSTSAPIPVSTEETMQQPSIQSPVDSPVEDLQSESHLIAQFPKIPKSRPVSSISFFKNRVISLQQQNSELAEALATIVGLEAENGNLDPKAVLDAYRQIKTGTRVSGSGVEGIGRRGRVFTS